jgi:periplasmic protein TonB
MDLQKELLESSNNKEKRSWRATVGSLMFHGLLVAGVVYAGTREVSHKVASERPINAFITQGAAPPPPPPPPPPPAPSSGAPRQATPRVQPKPIVVPQSPLTPPVEIPKEVPKVELPVSRDLPVVDTPVADEPSGGTIDQGPGDAANGVPGGVAGGVAGGVVGGEVGGVIGGEIGGVKGGEIGGVLGGEVGGKGTGKEGEGTGGVEAPPPPPAGPLRVGGDVKAPVVISRVEPTYPEVARKARISGIVIVECIIDKNGNVTNVQVLKPLPFGLDQAAADAVRRWKFRPGTLNGQPVDVIFNLTVNFKLN